jgi:hypothetical protein
MTANPPKPEWRRTCLSGLKGAINRVRAAIDCRSDPAVAVSEALHWVYCIHDYDRKVEGASHTAFLTKFLAAGDDREIAGALAAVRGDQVHDFMDLVNDADLFPSEHLYPGDDVVPGVKCGDGSMSNPRKRTPRSWPCSSRESRSCRCSRLLSECAPRLPGRNLCSFDETLERPPAAASSFSAYNYCGSTSRR